MALGWQAAADEARYPWEKPLHSGRGYPRPQLVRDEWFSLDGKWEFALDRDGSKTLSTVRFDSTIEVPFSVEAPLSGVGDTGFFDAAWYRRRFSAPSVPKGSRLLLHFGAVDYTARVWLNGQEVVQHEGGYTPFSADITDQLVEGTQQLVVRAFDDPFDLAKPRGKQDWQLEAHSIWYPRTTGIWQTVWMEVVPALHVTQLRWTSSLSRWEVGIGIRLAGAQKEVVRANVQLRANDRFLVRDTFTVDGGELHRRIALSDPGIDDFRNTLLWSPESPTLIEATIELWGARGERLDRVQSYTALRSVAVQGDRIVLNGRPYPLRLVLDQGYWKDGGLTAPSDQALKRDVELAKAMSFNGVRKHQKLEDPRYLYWADRLGLLVWEEMPSAYRYTQESILRATRQWLEALERDRSHPCIIAWVPFNESWGVPNLPDNREERHYVQALYHLTHAADPSRLVIGNDGWEAVSTDVIGIHDYDADAERIARRYAARDATARLFRHERPGGRQLVLDHRAEHDHPIMLSEFGGITISHRQGDWGYSREADPSQLSRRYARLLKAVHSLEVFTGFCYTQLTDTYQEANGLLTMDRQPKFSLEEIAAATRGPPRTGEPA